MITMDYDIVYQILVKLGLKKIKKTSNGYTASCPFHEDKNPSFSISKKGLWICFSCLEKGNINKLIKILGYSEADFLDNIKLINLMLSDNNNNNSKKEKKINDFFYYTYKLNNIPNYLLNRLEIDTIQRFKLGYTTIPKYSNRIIIPIFYNKRFVGFNARALDVNQIPKYLNSETDIKKYIFNYDNLERNKPLLICEGAFNCMSAWEKGFKNATATFGTSVSADQIKLITSLNPTEIIIGFDNDSNTAGNKASQKLAMMLKDFWDVYYLPLPLDKDINDLTKEEFFNIVNIKIKYE